MMANNSAQNKMYSESTYRVGDYVYFESSSSLPYQIRRIEELNKAPSGNVEAKVMCFYRRRDLPISLVQLADKHQMAQAEDSDSPVAMKLKKMWLKTPVSEEQAAQAVLDPAIAALEEQHNNSVNGTDKSDLSPKQKHQMKHRELFLSRQVETLAATQIRGKCAVTLLNEEESLLSYLNKDDSFFYCLVFDPTQKTLLADKGEIRVGSRYQTDMQNLLKEEEDDRKFEDLETLLWTPHHNLSDRSIDQFLVVSRSVGTFARALDCSSSVKQPSLHMSAAAASRDITLFHAMDTLHKHNYSIEASMCSLVPSSGPVLCRDEMEEWSASEANLFEEALDKYGKDFNDIRNDFLPWKTLKNIVEYYYMWKTTDRYVQQKRVKAVEAESKLKHVYIPNYTKPNPALITNNNSKNGSTNGNNDILALNGGKPCESCFSSSSASWYSWGPAHMTCRLCQTCWNYWKKYGGLKTASRLADNENDALKKRSLSEIDEDERLAASIKQNNSSSNSNCGKDYKLKTHLVKHFAQAHGFGIRSNSPRPIMKTRSAFYLQTTLTTKLSRKLCRSVIKSKKAARQPSYAISLNSVKAEFANQVATINISDIKNILKCKKKDRGSVTLIANRLGNPSTTGCEWLKLTPRDLLPKPEKVAYPKPPKAPDGSLIYERIPNKVVEPEKFVIPNTIGCTIITPSNMATPQPSFPNLPASVTATPVQQPLPLSNKRRYDSTGSDPASAPPPTKRPNKDPMPSYRPSPEQYAAMIEAAKEAGQPLPSTHMNGKPKIAQITRTGSGRKKVISWNDAPDDYYFRPTEANKKTRRNLTAPELRRLARKPWRKTGLNETTPAATNTTPNHNSSIAPNPTTSGENVVVLD